MADVGRLGNGVNTAHIYDQRGERLIADLKRVQSTRWTRSLNAISEAGAVIGTGQHADCCEVLGSIGTWGHSLVMKRNGVRVWEGPITSIRWSKGAVALGAHDVLGWSMKRATETRLVAAPGNFVSAEGAYDLSRIYANNDPNVLAWIDVAGNTTGPRVTRDVKAYGGYYDDQLNELVKGGLMFTTTGRRVLLWHNGYIRGRLPTLLPLTHMSGDVEILEDGLALAVRAIGVNDKGQSGVAAGSVAVDPFYGQVEAIVPYEAADAANLAIVAEQHREQHFPAPVSLSVPAGSVLSCDAPYDINELVAGSLMTVKVDQGVCRLIEATQQLSSVEVTQDKDGEKVAITVAPTSGVLT